jgi:hypothetical protein
MFTIAGGRPIAVRKKAPQERRSPDTLHVPGERGSCRAFSAASSVAIAGGRPIAAHKKLRRSVALPLLCIVLENEVIKFNPISTK